MPFPPDLKARLANRPSTLIAPASLVGAALGLVLAAVGSATRPEITVASMVGIDSIAVVDPLIRLPRTSMAVAAGEARDRLAQGRPWAAWESLRDHVTEPENAPDAIVLIAARAAAAWGGWDHVRRLLRDQPWLDRQGGEAWTLLGRAWEAGERWDRAVPAYRRAVLRSEGRTRGMANARLARALRRTGNPAGATAAYAAAAADLPELADWMRALQAETLGTGATPALPAAASSPARLRWFRAEAREWIRGGEVQRTVAEAERQAALLAPAETAALALDRARWLLQLGRGDEARAVLQAAAADPAAPARPRMDAARRLGEIAGALTPAERLAQVAAWEAGGKPGLAARALRGVLADGADPVARLKLGVLLFAERDFGPARAVLLQAAEQLPDPEQAALAELHAAQALYRDADAGQRSAELRRLAERRPGTAAAGSALFLLGDGAPALRDALRWYRLAAEARSSPDAREALFRVGDRSLRLKDVGAAVQAWEAYVARYPTGEQTAEAAYRAGVIHEADRAETRARALYTAAITADPVSYHALRAAERLGVDPLGAARLAPRPWVGLASEPDAARAVLARLDALAELGLDAEWDAERTASERAFADQQVALLTLAEGLAQRGHAVDAIRIGRGLLEQRGGAWDPRLLRVVFPLPLRGVIEAEAERAGVDPMLLAALIRQESTFRPAVESRVGATGLAQLMPATARILAPAAGVDDWQGRLLRVPEVNARMGALYLRDMLRRYDGAEDLALAAYNAGPGRADRWKTELRHRDGPDAFRDRIPFAETREYVKVVLRNQAVYRRLYGNRAPGLISME